jgi:putative membrane-bound dehydrogenase-like protein
MKRIIAILALGIAILTLRAEPPDIKTPPLLSPQEEQKTFKLHPGFRIELVACEPQITDPVALTFDHDGRLYVCEMRGYPNGGYGTGQITSGSIKLLEDKDGDGFFETATTFADGLRFPMGVQPWKKGVIAAVAPDLLYLEDTDGDGKADVKKVLYTGFGTDNIQQLLNTPQFGMDNWFYVCNGASGGTIRCPDKSDFAPLALGNRGIRFKPDVPGSLEPMSGGGQYGLSPNANQDWFVNTNSEHLKQIVLPDHYLRRNPGQAAPTPWLNIPEHGAACEVFRISPFEAWRVERTGRRASAPDSARYPKTELVPGGYITSACSPCVYEADLFPKEYRGNVFICEPANNLVLRDGLVEIGPVFKSVRLDPKQEFLASTDNCFRPVHASIGPDGALYIVDFYRPVIETPRSLPDDMKAKLPLETQKRGRIWRVVPEAAGGFAGKKPRMSQDSSADLVAHLDDPNIWWRFNAQRVLIERREKPAVPALHKLATEAAHDFGRAHAMWTLRGLSALNDDEIAAGLAEGSVVLKCQSLRLAEGRMQSDVVRNAAVKLADDRSPRVRLQAAFSLGESGAPDVVAGLAHIIEGDFANSWIMAAVLSSTRKSAPALIEALVSIHPVSYGLGPITARLAGQIAVNGDDAELAALLKRIAAFEGQAQQLAALRALGEGLQNSRRPMQLLWKKPPADAGPALEKLRSVFDFAFGVLLDKTTSPEVREALIVFLGFGPFDLVGSEIIRLVVPQRSQGEQVAAVRALAAHNAAEVPSALIKAWPNASPAVRREIQEALFARADRLPALLDAIEKKTILPQQLDPARVAQLRKLPDAKLRKRAEALLLGAIDANRQKVIDAYKSALDLPAEPEKGKALFKKNCATCHKLEDVGVEVGPDLRSALRDKTGEQLLISILDPSREVDRRYTNYLVETTGGRSFSGMIAAETATSVTLRRAEKAEDVILRTQIESITDTGKSLMPDGLEQQLSKQDLADLIAYLRGIK